MGEKDAKTWENVNKAKRIVKSIKKHSKSFNLHLMPATIKYLNRLDEGERLLVLSEIESEVNR